LQKIAKSIEGVESVSTLAGYEVLTEGRGSNAGTCLINLKNWDERKLTAPQIIAELEQKLQRDRRCHAGVLRASGGARLWRGGRLLAAPARQDEHG
jgi:multidrug efflux pump subunit AcrB